MTLDAAEWPRIAQAWGSEWSLIPNGTGQSYVATFRRDLCELTDQPGSGHTSRLSRLLMGARRGEIVMFHDRDPLNLTRRNMELLDRKAANAWRIARAFSATIH